MSFKRAREEDLKQGVYVVTSEHAFQTKILAVFTDYGDAVKFTHGIKDNNLTVVNVPFNPNIPKTFPDYIS